MKEINRKEYISLLLSLSKVPSEKPIVIMGISQIGKMSIINRFLHGNFVRTEGNLLNGLSEHVAKSECPIIVYNCRFKDVSSQDFSYGEWMQEVTGKQVVMLVDTYQKNILPNNLDEVFDCYMYKLSFEEWLEWAKEKEEKGVQNVDPLITDFISSCGPSVYRRQQWEDISESIRFGLQNDRYGVISSLKAASERLGFQEINFEHLNDKQLAIYYAAMEINGNNELRQKFLDFHKLPMSSITQP